MERHFRRCVDYAVKIRVNPQQTGIDTNVKHSMVRTLVIFMHVETHTLSPNASPSNK